MSKIRAHVLITGRVQGVFFRSETHKHARLLHLTGWVRNLGDGRVEAVFEGEDDDVDKMIIWCHKGPPSAVVTHVAAHRETYTGEFDSFSITF